MPLEKKKYNFRELTQLSAEAFTPLQTEKGAIFNVAAAMAALAKIESNGVVNAKGDGGSSWGLWQINSKVWPIGSREDDFTTFFGQVPWAKMVAQDALKAIAWAYDNRRFRRQVEGNWVEPEMFNPPLGKGTEMMPAVWYNILWQWGAPNFRDWIINSHDHTGEGFIKYRKSIGKPVIASFRQRLVNFRTYYTKAEKLLQDYPEWWRDFVKPTAKDVARLPGKIFGAAQEAADELKKPPLWVYGVIAVAGLYFLSPLIKAGGSRLEK